MAKLFSIVLLLSTLLYAKEALTLDEALKKVESQNLDLQIARYKQEIKAFEVEIAKGYSYGRFDLVMNALRSNDAGKVFGFKLQSREADFGDFGFKDFLAAMPAVSSSILQKEPRDLNYPQTRNHFQTKLTYKLPLYTGGELTQYKRIQRSLQEMSSLEYTQLLNTKKFEVKKTFYELSLLHRFLKRLQLLQKNTQRLHESVEAMIAQGYAKKVDLLEVKVKRSQIRELIEKTKLNQSLGYEFLSFLLQTQVGVIEYIKADAPSLKLQDKEYLENKIDILKAKLGKKITKQMITMQESAFMPKIGAFAEYGSSDDQFLNDFRDKDSYTVGMQLRWNLFKGNIDTAKLKIAKINNAKTALEVALAKEGIKLQVKKLKTQIKKSEANLKSLHRQKRFKKAVYENYLGRYKEKLADINDVVLKHSQLIQIVLEIDKEQNRRNSKIFELEKLIRGVGR